MKKRLLLTAMIAVTLSANASMSWPVNPVEDMQMQTSKFPTGKLPVVSWPIS